MWNSRSQRRLVLWIINMTKFDKTTGVAIDAIIGWEWICYPLRLCWCYIDFASWPCESRFPCICHSMYHLKWREPQNVSQAPIGSLNVTQIPIGPNDRMQRSCDCYGIPSVLYRKRVVFLGGKKVYAKPGTLVIHTEDVCKLERE